MSRATSPRYNVYAECYLIYFYHDPMTLDWRSFSTMPRWSRLPVAQIEALFDFYFDDLLYDYYQSNPSYPDNRVSKMPRVVHLSQVQTKGVLDPD